MDKIGVKEDSVASEPLKRMGSIMRPMTDEERKIFQSLVDEGFAQFKDAIKQGRPKFRKDSKTLDRLATGQIYSAQQAKKEGSSIGSGSSTTPCSGPWNWPTSRGPRSTWCAIAGKSIC